ncbi:MAG: TetR/AcrR family transcriptional regulator [Rhodothermus sp.]|nr:TetR/AcrR family transcriptional regulator [Rhodothermus sp.]
MARSGREAELYRVAARVFRRKGLRQARLQDVADELGVPRGVLFYYVTSKADLIRAVLEAPLCQLIQQARKIVASNASPEVKLTRLVEQHLHSLTVHRESWMLLHCESRETLQQVHTMNLEALLQQYENCWKEVIAEGMAQGIFGETLELDAMAQLCIGLVQGVHCWRHLTDKEAPKAVATWLMPLLRRSLGGVVREPSVSINP